MQEYTVAGFADDLARLCDQLHIAEPVVVGHSNAATRHEDWVEFTLVYSGELHPIPPVR